MALCRLHQSAVDNLRPFNIGTSNPYVQNKTKPWPVKLHKKVCGDKIEVLCRIPSNSGQPIDSPTTPCKCGQLTNSHPEPCKCGQPIDSHPEPCKCGQPIDSHPEPCKCGQPIDSHPEPCKCGQPIDIPTTPCKCGQPIDDKLSVCHMWRPVDITLISPIGARDNTRKSADGPVTSERHTCSAERSTLSTMLPNIGRVVRRTQVDWGVTDHTGAPTFTNEPETFFPFVESAPVRFAHHHDRIYRLPHYM